MVGYEAFAVPTILISRVETERGTEVEQNPRRYTTQVRDIVEHTDIVSIQTCLVFFTPGADYVLITGLTIQCFAAKFRDNQRFVRQGGKTQQDIPGICKIRKLSSGIFVFQKINLNH